MLISKSWTHDDLAQHRPRVQHSPFLRKYASGLRAREARLWASPLALRHAGRLWEVASWQHGSSGTASERSAVSEHVDPAPEPNSHLAAFKVFMWALAVFAMVLVFIDTKPFLRFDTTRCT